MTLTAVIQTDAVEFYHHSGVVSEYKSGFGTVWWFGIGWCLLKIEKLVVLVPYRLWWAKCLNEAVRGWLRASHQNSL